ncbi:MAG: GTP cyclohydrolase I FolE [Candidatus Sericytochromatia bacterium]
MSLDKEKIDLELGIKVSEYLKTKNVETPKKENHLTDKEKIGKIKSLFTEVMETLGLDLEDDSLRETPDRVAKMFVREIYWGLNPENFPKITTVENKMGYDSMVLEKNISVQSNCEHHFIVIEGIAHVAYIPKNKVLGISKINRVVEYFAKRPQIQERLTEQIFYALEYILETSDIAVIVDAKHYCVRARGVEDESSETITSKFGGAFRQDINLKKEFLSLIHR